MKVKLPDASRFETSSSWERCVSGFLQHEPAKRVQAAAGAEWAGPKKQRIDLISRLLHECKQGELTKLSPFTQRKTDEGEAGAGRGFYVPFRGQCTRAIM